MKFLSFLPLTALLVILASCGNSGKQAKTNNDTMSSSNPFASESKLPFQAADFNKIKNSDYKPAIEEGMKQQLAEIGKIAGNPDAPTFENTFVAMEKSGQLLRRVSGVFGLVTSANTNPELQKTTGRSSP